MENIDITLSCPKHNGERLNNSFSESYRCPKGCSYPITGNIPRFVQRDNYASSFGLQWNEYRTTQLDSSTGLSISRDRLTRLMGGSLDVVKGKKVLEAGCGAGRFTELLLEAGGEVCAVDLSTAVDANYMNCRHRFEKYFVCQASILDLPFESGQFDIVVCIGVIQHTPDPEGTIAALCRQVKPGGMLVIDHYTHGYPATLSRRILRSVLIRLPGSIPLNACKAMTACLWPLHRCLWRWRTLPVLRRLRRRFLRLSPVVDYHDAYPQLGPERLKIWAVLDTHDTLTDYYKHLRSADEIRDTLSSLGMERIETAYAGNGVEARAYKPIP